MPQVLKIESQLSLNTSSKYSLIANEFYVNSVNN